MTLENLSANKMYKLSGTSLPFKEWIDQEKAKGMVIPNKPALDAYMNMDGTNANTAPEPSIQEANVRMAKNLFRTAVLVGAIVIVYKIWIKKH